MDKKIRELIEKTGNKFKESNLSLVTAESCTGGSLAYYFTRSKNCSSILERGYITYSNQAKEEILKVNSDTLQLKGAVSKKVAIEMSNGALKNSGAQVSIAITGLAGYDRKYNENQKKLLGIVWISCTDIYGKQIIKKKEIKGDRDIFVKTTIKEALIILFNYIKQFNK